MAKVYLLFSTDVQLAVMFQGSLSSYSVSNGNQHNSSSLKPTDRNIAVCFLL